MAKYIHYNAGYFGKTIVPLYYAFGFLEDRGFFTMNGQDAFTPEGTQVEGFWIQKDNTIILILSEVAGPEDVKENTIRLVH